GEAGHMPKERGVSVAVVEHYGAAVSIAHLRFFNDAVCRREDGLAVSAADVHTTMECTFTVERIIALAKGAHDAAFDGPKIGRRRQLHPVIECGVPGAE